jgi:hypothetical protein
MAKPDQVALISRRLPAFGLGPWPTHSVVLKRHYAAATQIPDCQFPPTRWPFSTLLLVPPQQASPINTGLTSTPPLVQSRQQIERFALVLAVHSFKPTSLDSSGEQLFRCLIPRQRCLAGLSNSMVCSYIFSALGVSSRAAVVPYTRRLSWDSLTARADLGLELPLIV